MKVWGCCLLFVSLVIAADNGRAYTPPMGWNSWYALGCDNLNQTAVQDTADIIAASWNGQPSLLSYGYEFLVLDDCWMAYERDEQGNMIADPSKFPDGMKSLSSKVRSLGLEMGLYTTPGNLTCEGRAATGGHEQQDVQQFVLNWEMRYIKYCMCNTTHEWRLEAYGIFYSAVNDTGIPVTIENDPPEHPWTWLAPDANLWGIYDIEDSFDAWLSRVNELQDRGEAPYAGPTHWNMPDMLQIGNGGQTNEEYRCQMSMYSLLAAPLFLGTDVRFLTQETYDLITNQRVINVNQDSLGIQGQRMTPSGTASQIWSKKMNNGSFVVVFLNANENTTAQESITWQELLDFWADFVFLYGDSYTTSDAIRDYWKDQTAENQQENMKISIIDLWSGELLSVMNSTSQSFNSSLLAPHTCQMIQLNFASEESESSTSSSNWHLWTFISVVVLVVLLTLVITVSFILYRRKKQTYELEESLAYYE